MQGRMKLGQRTVDGSADLFIEVSMNADDPRTPHMNGQSTGEQMFGAFQAGVEGSLKAMKDMGVEVCEACMWGELAAYCVAMVSRNSSLDVPHMDPHAFILKRAAEILNGPGEKEKV